MIGYAGDAAVNNISNSSFKKRERGGA